jgi:hypothetical protein
MTDVLTRLREACAAVAERAEHVRVERGAITGYAASLPPNAPAAEADSPDPAVAFCLTLDAINFGSGWFPTLRKRHGKSGYGTIAAGITERFQDRGAWTAEELAEIGADEIAFVLGQDPGHELVGLFAESLGDLGRHLRDDHGGSFMSVVDGGRGSAAALVTQLASWDCFADTSTYQELELPFLKRAQLAAADLARAGVWRPTDLERLTMFADNLVPHVLRLDGVLEFDPELVARINREELIEHGSPEEVEIRACALHAIELIVAARPATRASDVDLSLWLRGQQPYYKASPRHRSRTTAY